jgi:EAL domain-containing protein (putative c-di-GMP-specific phosphodiesterase class I)
MPILSSNIVIYQFTMDEIKNLICADMNIKPDAVKLEVTKEYIQDNDDYSFRNNYTITGLKVIIDNTI